MGSRGNGDALFVQALRPRYTGGANRPRKALSCQSAGVAVLCATCGLGLLPSSQRHRRADSAYPMRRRSGGTRMQQTVHCRSSPTTLRPTVPRTTMSCMRGSVCPVAAGIRHHPVAALVHLGKRGARAPTVRYNVATRAPRAQNASHRGADRHYLSRRASGRLVY